MHVVPAIHSALLNNEPRPPSAESIVTTPSGTTGPIATVASIDSGLSSQQPSTSCVNKGAWSLFPQYDGSVLRELKPSREERDLSISQIDEEDDTIPLHLTTAPPPNISEGKIAPELSIVRINQSDSSVVVPPSIPANIASEVHSIEGTILTDN